MKNARRNAGLGTLAGVVAVVLGACGDETPAGPEADVATLVAIAPQGGATGVDRHTGVVVEFDHPMMPGMEAYAALHEDDLTGPEVPGTWAMSADRMRITFTPDHALAPNTTYVIHLGGGMMDGEGHFVDFEDHGPGMGGRWATGSMMGGGMHGGPTGGPGSHRGVGWRHPTNGSYGMVFVFTTGA